MRIVLSLAYPFFKAPRHLPENIFGFYSHEDFTVGPRPDWDKPEQFRAARAEYWAKIDGIIDYYYTWGQFAPYVSFEDLIKDTKAGIERPHPEAEDLLPQADQIEIWADPSPLAQTCLWYTLADLHRMGISHERISLCRFDDLKKERGKGFCKALLCDDPERELPAEPITAEDMENACALWLAVTKLPALSEISKQDDATARIFTRLAGRFPTPETGLTELQHRLLDATRSDWLSMVRPIAEAMAKSSILGDPVGDEILRHELEQMACLTPAPVEIEGSGQMRFCKVRLTDADALYLP